MTNMMLLTAISGIIGFLLGLRFIVWLLIPVIVFAMIIILGVGIAHGDDAKAILLAMFLAGIALQFGYVLGAVASAIVTQIRFSKSVSPLSQIDEIDAFADAKVRFQDILAKAKTGDKPALGQLAGASKNYLDLASWRR